MYDWVKLNLGGDHRENLGMMRNNIPREDSRSWVQGFLVKFRIYSLVKAKLQVLLHGLKIARKEGFKEVLVHLVSPIVMRKMQELVKKTKPAITLSSSARI